MKLKVSTVCIVAIIFFSLITVQGQDRPKLSDTEKQRILTDWQTPINFFGKVVDEKSNAVSEAEVDFQCNDLSTYGTSFYRKKTDSEGRFSIDGIQGKLLKVTVSKAGYYSRLPKGANYYYAGQNENFSPHEDQPEIFYLRKKGTPEALIHFYRSFKVTKDGLPINIDLRTGKVVASMEESIKVQCWIYPKENQDARTFAWKCRISVDGGGLQIYEDAFPFLAPETGYQTGDLIDMTHKEASEWKADIIRKYYVKTANNNFARITFRIVAHGDNFCIVDSSLNPSGSRNLEPQ